MNRYYSEYSKVWVAVDGIILGFEEKSLKILIGRRKMDPGRGEWSLYGGFVNPNESLGQAAQRVIHNLTGLENLYIRQVGAFGEVDRDPGNRVISVAYLALINVADYNDDLRKEHGLEWVNLEDLPPLFSDHNQMIQEALKQIRKQINNEPIGFNLLPQYFTLTQLQNVFEAILGEEIDKRNFRKRIKEMNFIEKTELIDKTTSKKGAYLYQFNESVYKSDPIFKI